MDSIETLRPGTELTNDELCAQFKCSPQGGMRRSLETGTLVIVCNHVASIYDDRWIEGSLHYTGMGQHGDQSLDFMQNRTLAESNSSGVAVHLFEVFKPKIYTYVGLVDLAAPLYQEAQLDEDGQTRQVWIFPVAPRDGQVPAMSVEVVRELEERKAKKTRRLSDAEVEQRAKQSRHARAGVRSAITQQYQRNPWVAEHAKRRAKGVCALCQEPAPFLDGAGQPYLETHHIVWLARDGSDTIGNTVALCPNCHRRMHILDDSKDVASLQSSTVEQKP